MHIRRAAPAELASIASLRRALWPESPLGELEALVAARPDYLVLIASANGGPVGFAEVSLRRDYVNGCETSPVAFLEAIYVDPAHRRRGVARALVDAAVEAAREWRVAEFASDALLDNAASHAFHRATGFEEVERVVCFRRPVGRAA